MFNELPDKVEKYIDSIIEAKGQIDNYDLPSIKNKELWLKKLSKMSPD